MSDNLCVFSRAGVSHDPFVAVYDLHDPRRAANPTEEGHARGVGGGDSVSGAASASGKAFGQSGGRTCGACPFLSPGVGTDGGGTARSFAPGAVLIASDGVWDNWKYEDVGSALLRPAQILRVARATHPGIADAAGTGTATQQALHAAPAGGDVSNAGPLGGPTRSVDAHCGLSRQGANTDQWHAVGGGAVLAPGAAPRVGVAKGGVGCPTTMANEFMDKNAELAKMHFGSQADNMTAVVVYVLPL